jgi:hypothetical protein
MHYHPWVYNPTLYLFEVKCWRNRAPDDASYFLIWSTDETSAELDCFSTIEEEFDHYAARRDESTMPATLDELQMHGAAYCAARIDG